MFGQAPGLRDSRGWVCIPWWQVFVPHFAVPLTREVFYPASHVIACFLHSRRIQGNRVVLWLIVPEVWVLGAFSADRTSWDFVCLP